MTALEFWHGASTAQSDAVLGLRSLTGDVRRQNDFTVEVVCPILPRLRLTRCSTVG